MEMPAAPRRLVIALGIFVLFGAPSAQAAIGRTPGAPSVTPLGEASYSIPIVVPPGTNGMTPVLSLEYRHRSRGGLLGVGWSIGGLSQITRCARTVAQDGIAAPPRRSGVDRFCLDGQRLVVANGSLYGAANAEYRTEIESFARIRSFQGTSTNGPGWFTVEAADGRVYEYGATNDSRIDGVIGPSTSGARTWALNRIRDRAGNVIDYRYMEESGGGAYRIASIHYNANPTAGIAASHKVSFVYESRPVQEVDTGFVTDMPVRQVVRLERIEVLYQDKPVRRYDLEYEPALSSGGRSRLASLQECGSSTLDCLAPTTFAWQDGAAGAAVLTYFSAAVPIDLRAPWQRGWNFADVNGDGRADAVWAGGTDQASATVRYRLSRGGGSFGPMVDTGMPGGSGIGVPFDANGDGRADFLMYASGSWAIAYGSTSGLTAAVSTGIALPQGLRDFRGADLNGDGLGDIAWSEVADPSFNTLKVRARFALAAGGYGAPVTLYSQFDVMSYVEPEGGNFLGSPGQRVDLDGDGAEELLMNENYSLARISARAFGTDRFASPFPGLVALDFNDDDCADLAYRDPAGGFMRLRVGQCAIGGTMTEFQGPSWTGPAELHAHDWNADGRDDLLLRGPVNWMVALSRGDSFAPLSDTGVPHEDAKLVAGRDLDGDGLQDIAARTTTQLRLRFRSGPVPDLLLSATDGLGVAAEFSYEPLTANGIHTVGKLADYPDQDLQTNDLVVAALAVTDGSGKGTRFTSTYRYVGLRRNTAGRGLLGFRKVTRTEPGSALPLTTEVTYRQDYPFAGLPESVALRQPSGIPVSTTEHQWSKVELGTGWSVRRFPYASTVITRRYESGGLLDGKKIVDIVRSVAAIDPASGLVTDETTTTTEVGGGANAGAVASLRTLHTSVLNDTANWCLGRSQSVQLTASHSLPGGEAVTRSADQSWDALTCRPTQIRLMPGDAKWEITYDFAYDAFGNISSEGITGAGMATRVLTTQWGARGRLPVRSTDPSGQVTQFAWDTANGLPLSHTDPNGAVSRWTWDGFGRLTSEMQPDGTSTVWTRESCKGTCYARARYRIRQDDRDSAGATRVSASLEVDQHDRGIRLESGEPGGGRSVASVLFNAHGRLARRDVPYWDGGNAPGSWQFAYDELGRPINERLVTAGGSVIRESALEYQGLKLVHTDPLGRTTTATRSAWGSIIETADALAGRTRYEYDAFGGLTGVRDPLDNLVASIGYNVRGMKVSVDDMDGGSWTWTRNALGETRALRDGKGQVLRFEYDKLGRLKKRDAPDGTSIWTWGSTPAKHDIGRLVAVSGPGYSETFSYDAIGRPVTHSILTDASYEFGFSYNALGLLDRLTYPAAGSDSAFRIRHDYDAGRVSRVWNADKPAVTYWQLNAQDAAGHVLDESFGAGPRVVTGYAPVGGEMEYRQAGIGGGAAIQDLAWEWDAKGNLALRRDIAQGLVEIFRYDALDRLEETRRNGVTDLELDYDAIGNIVRKSDVCTGTGACYEHHASRRHAVVSAGGRTYAYDANGNMISRGGAAIAWTSDNRPISIQNPNGNSSQFSYGPAGNRWRQVAKYGSATETTIYAGGLFEKVTRGGVTTWRHYVPAPGGVAVRLHFSDGTPGTMRYLTLDHLGSPHRIVDREGNVLVAESFAPFGARRGPTWTGTPTAAELAEIAAATRDGFTGHEHLDNLDLIHMNGRVYDPVLGRFISADPYVFGSFDSQGLNRYSYVLNNPLAFTDPSGYDAVPCLATQDGNCVQITVIGVTWADYMRAFGGAHSSEIASALERDPCGQNGSALACSMATGTLVSPSSIVLTVGQHTDSTLSTGGRLDSVQGFAARIGNVAISSSPIALLFGADPDFQYFREPDSAAGRAGSYAGNVGYLLGGLGGIVRKGGAEIVRSPSQFARSLQGNTQFPGIDDFRDIILKKGKVIYAGFPGQGFFYTTQSAMRRVAESAGNFNRGLQIAPHRRYPPRTRYAAYEVIDNTPAAFGLALANPSYGPGWLPQIVVPSFATSLRYLGDFALGP